MKSAEEQIEESKSRIRRVFADDPAERARLLALYETKTKRFLDEQMEEYGQA